MGRATLRQRRRGPCYYRFRSGRAVAQAGCGAPIAIRSRFAEPPMIADAGAGVRVPQRPFLRNTIRTTSKTTPPTIHASSQVIGHLPLAAAFPWGKSAIAIVRDWEIHETMSDASLWPE